MRGPRGSGWRAAKAAAALAVPLLLLPGCAAEKACTAAAPRGGVGVTAADGVTDGQGTADLAATVCLRQECRTTPLGGEPNRRGALVAGFVDLPLASTDPATLTVTLTRGATTAAGPYEVTVHPAAAGGQDGCQASTYVASLIVDLLGAQEAPPPRVPAPS